MFLDNQIMVQSLAELAGIQATKLDETWFYVTHLASVDELSLIYLECGTVTDSEWNLDDLLMISIELQLRLSPK